MIDNRLDQNFLKTLTVLYVEDDDDTREQYSEFMQRPVGRLITAADGAEGLEAFVKHSPDIVITDIQMPRMDGLSMAYEIRGISPSVPIIVITAFEQNDYLLRAVNIGIDKYVTKPVNGYLLLERLYECVHRLRAEQQLKLQHQREIKYVWSKHSEAVATFASGIAHDYNRLMHNIIRYASLAKQHLEPDSESINYLVQIEKCSEGVNELGEMLRILGMDYGENLLYGSVSQFVRHSVKHVVEDTPVTLSVDYQENLPDVSFVEHLVHLVFSGLALNAVESMPSGGVLRLAAKTVEIAEGDSIPLEPGQYIHFSLTDTGAGIAPELLPKIFDLTFRTGLKPGRRSSGLKLPLCRIIIMNLGGLITAESTVGSGSVFHVWLPVTRRLS